ncbi:MAG: acylphosphatase, partial [Candidatus Cloacimonadota bacterium]|nr:acylphosphatase [Candidatus Cloacimonadota bacterium]
MKKALEMIVIGRVQGVGFRFYVKRKARLYGIVGYVKNLPNSNVKIVAIGEKIAMDNFMKKVKIGPDFSWVADVKISNLSSTKDYSK